MTNLIQRDLVALRGAGAIAAVVMAGCSPRPEAALPRSTVLVRGSVELESLSCNPGSPCLAVVFVRGHRHRIPLVAKHGGLLWCVSRLGAPDCRMRDGTIVRSNQKIVVEGVVVSIRGHSRVLYGGRAMELGPLVDVDDELKITKHRVGLRADSVHTTSPKAP